MPQKSFRQEEQKILDTQNKEVITLSNNEVVAYRRQIQADAIARLEAEIRKMQRKLEKIQKKLSSSKTVIRAQQDSLQKLNSMIQEQAEEETSLGGVEEDLVSDGQEPLIPADCVHT